jgi:hypothetical protein
MNRRLSFLLTMAASIVLLTGATYVYAQIGRIRIESSYYRVRVVNELGEWARIGMIGYDRDANMRVELNNRTSWTGNLYAGQRVVVAWDRNRNLIFASEVDVDRGGTLRLQPMVAFHAEQAAPARKQGRAERSGPLPKMTIEP